MPWIRTISPDQATGLLQRLYAAAGQRAGRVFQIIRLQSLMPRALQASTRLYAEVMFGDDGPLTRAQREMLATFVSRINGCHY